jgi:hypothetical protein
MDSKTANKLKKFIDGVNTELSIYALKNTDLYDTSQLLSKIASSFNTENDETVINNLKLAKEVSSVLGDKIQQAFDGKIAYVEEIANTDQLGLAFESNDKFIKFLDTLKTDDNNTLIESVKEGYMTINEGIFDKIIGKSEPYTLDQFIEDYGKEGFINQPSDDDKYAFITKQGTAAWLIDNYVVPVDYKDMNADGTIKLKGELKNIGDEDVGNVNISDILVPEKKYWKLFK